MAILNTLLMQFDCFYPLTTPPKKETLYGPNSQQLVRPTTFVALEGGFVVDDVFAVRHLGILGDRLLPISGEQRLFADPSHLDHGEHVSGGDYIDAVRRLHSRPLDEQ